MKRASRSPTAALVRVVVATVVAAVAAGALSPAPASGLGGHVRTTLVLPADDPAPVPPPPLPPPLPTPLPPAPPVVSPVDARIASALTARMVPTAFGSRLSGQVIDVATGRVVWALNAGWQLAPASTAKLVTATDALAVYGPAHRFTTSVRRGTSWAHVVLVGGGDPSLSGADLSVLAAGTVTQLRRHRATRVKVWFDDSLFAPPSLATGWKASYLRGDVRAVRSLAVQRRRVDDTALDAARIFAAKLGSAGIGVLAVGRGRAPAGSYLSASVRGQRLDTIVRQMLLTSDNDDAEVLHRLVALGVGRQATWAAAAAAQRHVIGAQGLRLGPSQLYDGSGLSRRDRLSAAQLVALVTHTLDPAQIDLASVASTALPVSGFSGTLRASLGRFATPPSSCAAGVVHAKTGTLDDAVTLAGWTTGADGQVKAFAFMVNGAGDSLRLKRRVDTLAATVTGCY